MLFFISTNQLAGYLPLLILNLTTYLSAGLENVIDQFSGQDSKSFGYGECGTLFRSKIISTGWGLSAEKLIAARF